MSLSDSYFYNLIDAAKYHELSGFKTKPPRSCGIGYDVALAAAATLPQSNLEQSSKDVTVSPDDVFKSIRASVAQVPTTTNGRTIRLLSRNQTLRSVRHSPRVMKALEKLNPLTRWVLAPRLDKSAPSWTFAQNFKSRQEDFIETWSLADFLYFNLAYELNSRRDIANDKSRASQTNQVRKNSRLIA